jgi:acyl-CoA thioester hydrolase
MKEEPTRSDYKVFYPVTTRWMDNDLYGHINNVVYYSYFDTVVNLYLIGKGGLNIHTAPIVGYVVNSGCNYLSPIGYPDKLEAGLRVDRIGNTSVHYGIAIFKEGNSRASAYGHVVHVFVNRDLNKPVPLPAEIHNALAEILA